MGLIDADVLKQHIDKLPALPDGNFAGSHSALKALINMQPTIQPEPTDEQVEEYCKRRCLHIVTDDFFHTIQPELQKGKWVLKNHLWECNKCGCRINVKNPLCEND